MKERRPSSGELCLEEEGRKGMRPHAALCSVRPALQEHECEAEWVSTATPMPPFRRPGVCGGGKGSPISTGNVAHSEQHPGPLPMQSLFCLSVLCLWPKWGPSPEPVRWGAGGISEGSFSEELGPPSINILSSTCAGHILQ